MGCMYCNAETAGDLSVTLVQRVGGGGMERFSFGNRIFEVMVVHFSVFSGDVSICII
jgi:hypothetical protein